MILAKRRRGVDSHAMGGFAGVKVKLAAKILFFCVLILVFSAPRVFSWQITSYQQIKDFAIEKEENQVTLNLVFVSLGYQEPSEFKKYISSITARLKSVFPFSKFKGFKFFLLKANQEEEKDIFKESKSFPYLKIRSDFIRELKNEIGGNYKLVILDKESNVSAAELSNAKEASLIILGRNSFGEKNRLAKAFLHEFGHSLGLREENSGSSHGIISGEPNCALDKETAIKWWGDIAQENSGVDYFEVKTQNKTFIKPTLGSIMNNPFKSYGYGPVNERYLCRELGLEPRGEG